MHILSTLKFPDFLQVDKDPWHFPLLDLRSVLAFGRNSIFARAFSTVTRSSCQETMKKASLYRHLAIYAGCMH